jgi:hypothetical protein
MTTREEHGVVMGRVYRGLIWIKTDSGHTTAMRLRPDLGSDVFVGQRARVTFDQHQRPISVALVAPSDSADGSRLVRSHRTSAAK